MKYYVVDAFAEKLFEGNPAGVCVLDRWPDDHLMLSIAGENNLSETAFTVKEGDRYHLRWFTPEAEIDLCGHATLATAFILSQFYGEKDRIVFDTLSGDLIVNQKEDLLEMDFPGYALKQVPVTDAMEDAIGFRPLEAWMGRDLVCVLENEQQVLDANPDNEKLLSLDGLLLHLTSAGSQYDMVSRSFAPKLAITEDPVCGSGHCHLAMLWAPRLGKNEMAARQASKRGGTLYIEVKGNRVLLSGKAVLYSIADLQV